MVTVETERPTGCQSPAPALSQINRHLLVNPARCQLQLIPMTPFAHVQGLDFGEENLPKPSGRASKALLLSPCYLLRLTWAHSGYLATERPTGYQSPVPVLSQVNRHLLVNPARCQLQMAPMTPFDTLIWPIFPKGNRPMIRPQNLTTGPNRDSKEPS